MTQLVSLYDAKTHLSTLVDRAGAGEQLIIAKNGVPRARLMPLEQENPVRTPANAMRIESIADDFDAPDPRIEQMFGIDSP